MCPGVTIVFGIPLMLGSCSAIFFKSMEQANLRLQLQGAVARRMCDSAAWLTIML